MRTAIVLIAIFVSAFSIKAQNVMKVPGVHDWGSMRLPSGLFLETVVPIENVAKNGQLRILEVKPECGCTKTEQDKSELLPGEVAKVKVRLDIAKIQAGKIVKKLTITALHGRDTIVKVVTLKVYLDRVVTMDPPGFVSFSGSVSGVESMRTLKISNPSSILVSLSNVSIEGDVTADLTNDMVIAPGDTRDVTIRLTPAKPGSIAGLIKFTASRKDFSEEYSLPVYGVVQKPAEK
ncbi:MAG: DUF1573 domain-containing protein [Candidatus Kapabacteria bacterium]|nr:DUF1573 domain-containing protein [Candidatus Kapabacteria bacterium]